MTGPVRLRATSAVAARHKGYANRLGAALHRQSGSTGSRSGIFDGFVFKARKQGGRVTVDVVEVPGRFEGSNQYRGVLDPLVGESMIDGIVTSVSPGRERMAPSSDAVTEVPAEERQGGLGAVQAFGDPLPDDPFLLYNSFPTEFDGGVIFVHFYTDAEPPGDGGTGYVVTDQPVWLAVLVRWAGAGSVRSVSFSEDYVRGLTGCGFYPRHVIYEGSPIVPIRYGARLPVAHYHRGRLSVAIELEADGGGVSTVGSMLAMGIHYQDGVATLEWSEIVGPADLGSALESDSFSGDAGTFQAAGFDLPAVYAWVDASGADPVPVTLVSFRARCRKAVGGSYRIVTGQALLVVTNGIGSLSVSFVDSIAGLDAGLPQIEAARIFVQKYRDTFFLDASGMPVRHRLMRLLARPAVDADISPAAPTTLPIHSDIALLRTESAAGTISQTQALLGYGPEEMPASSNAGNGGNGIENIGFSTPVADGEVWGWGFINGSSATQIGIARITVTGVAAPLAAGIPRSLRLSTYQREVRNTEGAVIVPMAQVATILDADEPKIAIKKGRFGALDFVPAASFSRFGTFYLASPASQPRYGRMFG